MSANDNLTCPIGDARQDRWLTKKQNASIDLVARPIRRCAILVTALFSFVSGRAHAEVPSHQPKIIEIGAAHAEDEQRQPVVVQLRPGGPVVILIPPPQQAPQMRQTELVPAELSPLQPIPVELTPAQMVAAQLIEAQQAPMPGALKPHQILAQRTYEPLAGSDLIAAARQFLGDDNPTSFQGIPWCGAFLGLVARLTGHAVPPGYLAAAQWSNAGEPLPGPRVGAIAVMPHHVGIVEAMTPRGPLLISGNAHDHKVAEGVYNADHVIAYVALR